MSINFPTSLDTLSNPVGTDKVNNAVAALKHATQHANANDAIEALEAKVGINGSAVTTTHDYKLSSVTSTDKAVSKASASFVGGKVLVSSANHGAVESDLVVQPGGLVGIAQGGLGVALSDPNANRLIGWDDATNTNDWVTIGSGLTLTAKTLTAVSTNINTTLTANVDLTAGTPVGIANITGGITKARRNVATATLDHTSTSTYDQSTPIGGNKLITLTSISGPQAQLSVTTVSTTTQSVTSGASVTATGNLYGSVAPVVIGIDTDKFVIFYVLDATRTVVNYKVGTVSGTTITLGSELQYYTSGGGGADMQTLSACKGATDAGIVTVDHGTSYVIAFTNSGTTLTIGSAVALAANLGSATGITAIGSNKYAIADQTGYVAAATVSGTTPTVGTEVQFGATVTAFLDFKSNTTDAFGILYTRAAGDRMRAGTVSGTTITLGTEISLTTATTLIVDSSTQFYVQRNSNLTLRSIGISGNTLTDNGTIMQSFGVASMKYLTADGGYWLGIGTSAATLTIVLKGMSNNFIGFAQSTVSAGQSVTVITKGLDANQSGLVAGNAYKVTDGALSFVSSGVSLSTLADIDVVKAVSATSVIF